MQTVLDDIFGAVERYPKVAGIAFWRVVIDDHTITQQAVVGQRAVVRLLRLAAFGPVTDTCLAGVGPARVGILLGIDLDVCVGHRVRWVPWP